MNEKIKEYFSNAEVAFVNGQHEVALEWCEKIISEDPTYVDAYTGAGKASVVLDRLDDAEKYFSEAVKIDNTSGEKYFNLANIKFGLEKYPEALANYAKAEQFGCEDDVLQKLYYQIGMLSHITGDVKSALLNFDKAENIGLVSSDTKDMLLKRIQIYVEAQDFASAESYAIQLKLLAPGEFRSYQIYFQIVSMMGKFEKAEEILREAEKYADVEADVQNKADVYFDKAMLLAVKADMEPENAATHYQSSLDLLDEFLKTANLPQDIITKVSFSKAELYLKLERFDDALICIKDIDADDDIEKANFIKLSCYVSKEDYEKVGEYADRLKGSENDQYVYFATYTDAFTAMKLAQKDKSKKELAEIKYNNAVAYFKNRAFENPQDVYAVMFRIRLYAENGKSTQAEELAKLLPETLKAELNEYILDCQKMG